MSILTFEPGDLSGLTQPCRHCFTQVPCDSVDETGLCRPCAACDECGTNDVELNAYGECDACEAKRVAEQEGYSRACDERSYGPATCEVCGDELEPTDDHTVNLCSKHPSHACAWCGGTLGPHDFDGMHDSCRNDPIIEDLMEAEAND